MLDCFALLSKETPVHIIPVIKSEFSDWLKNQNKRINNWVQSTAFKCDSGSACLVPNEGGALECVLLGLEDVSDFWAVGALPARLPKGLYCLDVDWSTKQNERAALAWGLGCYQFTRYKKPSYPMEAQLVFPDGCDAGEIESRVRSINCVRDLINMPTDDMGPADLVEAVLREGKSFGAKVKQIVGDDLLKQNYPAIHAVGRGSKYEPRLVDLRWGSKGPRITLVGKGVCFDSGGLCLKPASGMADMKKDMGGAAHVIGLARMIMQAKLPVRLRVLIPAVENSISGSAYHPGDIIATRKGLRVEVLNTDAEGRLILADALTEAVSESPDLLIDFATLTGAARVALGMQMAALFSNRNEVACDLLAISEEEGDPMWQLPLYRPYRKQLDSKLGDIANMSSKNQGAGAITAALFLKEFVPDEIPWVHFDIMGANVEGLPGRPEGGEAQGVRSVFEYLLSHYSSDQ